MSTLLCKIALTVALSLPFRDHMFKIGLMLRFAATGRRLRSSPAIAQARLLDTLIPGDGLLLLPFFNTYEACNLRLVGRLWYNKVTRWAWHDTDSRVCGSLELWRRCFPRASACNAAGNKMLGDTALIWLRHVRYVNLQGCPRVTDEGLQHLAGVHTLILRENNQSSLTSQGFRHLKGIHTLDMSYCDQTTITDTAFSHLAGIHTLTMNDCSQSTITNAALEHICGVKKLSINWCSQFSNQAFEHLSSIHTLEMALCGQDSITDAAFVHLRGIHSLDMHACNQATITDAAFTHLKGVHTLDMTRCNQATITDAAFTHLKGIHTLSLQHCNQATITDMAVTHLVGVHSLNLSNCSPLITDAAVEILGKAGVHTLSLSDCPSLTDAALQHLVEIPNVDLQGCGFTDHELARFFKSRKSKKVGK
jgi:hypothetical protein